MVWMDNHPKASPGEGNLLPVAVEGASLKVETDLPKELSWSGGCIEKFSMRVDFSVDAQGNTIATGGLGSRLCSWQESRGDTTATHTTSTKLIFNGAFPFVGGTTGTYGTSYYFQVDGTAVRNVAGVEYEENFPGLPPSYSDAKHVSGATLTANERSAAVFYLFARK
jgi:hypothetical protein